jgi:hypothetical protein
VPAWDLARATGGDEVLAADPTTTILVLMHPLAAALQGSGAFGPSGGAELPDDASPQQRILDLTGRRL